ncbi:hypothetical protein QBC43DRAFT_312038 [Cladorrhinum sp. PSN259]|nr:hypothetical protein QBC43DRAFT_312038 [Cladorrhinum sp. PSN259]
MGFLDDAASVISSRTGGHSTSKRTKSHRSSRKDRSDKEYYREHRDREHRHRDREHRSRSKSRSGSRSRRHHKSSKSTVGSVVGGIGAISGYAASVFGGGGGNDSDDEGLAYSSYKPSHKTSRSHHEGDRDRDRGHHHHDDDGTRSFFSAASGLGGADYAKNNGSFFNLGNGSKSSFFAGFGGRSRSPGHSSSFYKRSPRPNFMARLVKKLRRLFRDLVYYAKRHPLKVFMLVIMPLVSGGILTALLAKVGIRLPKFVERMISIATKAGTGDSVGLAREAAGMVKSTGGVGALVRSSTSTFEKGVSGDGTQWELARKVTKMIS